MTYFPIQTTVRASTRTLFEGCYCISNHCVVYTDSEPPRPHKRQKIAPGADAFETHTATNYPSITEHPKTTNMRDTQFDQDTSSLGSEAGPSSLPTNGHTNGHSYTSPPTKGSINGSGVVANGVQKHFKSIAQVILPGTALYEDESYVNREEFVRLILQSLRDVGYMYVNCFLVPWCSSFIPTHSGSLPRPLKQSLGTPWKLP